MAVHIALYGKSGVGKSTIASNVSAALAEEGVRVVQIGCDALAESTALLRKGVKVPSVLTVLESGKVPDPLTMAATGYGGVTCIELGDLAHPLRCAGDGLERATTFLRESGFFEQLQADIIIYDLPGEAPCGGLTLPIRKLVDRSYVVTSPELTALCAANGVFRSIAACASQRGALLGGIIGNALTSSFAESYIGDFALRTAAPVTAHVPRSLTVFQGELYGRTVIELSPKSVQAAIYRKIGRSILEKPGSVLPKPMKPERIREWAKEWGDRIYELETGIISPGAGI